MTLLFHIALSWRCVGRASSTGLASTMFQLFSPEPLKLKTPLKPHTEKIQRLSPQGNLSRQRMLVISTFGVQLKLPEYKGDIKFQILPSELSFRCLKSSRLSERFNHSGLTYPGPGTYKHTNTHIHAEFRTSLLTLGEHSGCYMQHEAFVETR